MWSLPAKNQQDMAAFSNKEGLVRASIEGKNFLTRNIRTLAECDGHDFNNFQWMAEFRSQGMFATTGVHQLLGLKLVTRDLYMEVYSSGEVKILQRPEEDKKFHYETFGR